MNSPVETDFEFVMVADLVPTKLNPRKERDKEADKALVESVKRDGVLQPGVARPVKNQNGHQTKYELLCGRRRFDAAKKAGCARFPVLIGDYNDNEALAVVITENLMREDITPFETAKAIDQLITAGKSLKDAAATIGMTAHQAKKYAQLLNLSKNWKETISEAGAYQSLPLEYLLEVARLAPGQQDDVLENSPYDWSEMTLPAWKSFVQEAITTIDGMPWDEKDDKLVPGKPCEGCKDRAAADDALFEDISTKKGVCLDSNCFHDKMVAFVKLNCEQLAAKHEQPVGVTLSAQGKDYGHTLDRSTFDNWVAPYDLVSAKKSDKGAKPFVRIDAEGVGKLVWRKSAAQKNADRRNEIAAKQAGRKPDEGPTIKEMEDRLAGRRAKLAVSELAADLRKLKVEALIALIDKQKHDWFTLVSTFGLVHNNCHPQTPGIWRDWEKAKTNPLNAKSNAAESLLSTLPQRLTFYCNPDAVKNIGEAKKICELLGWEWDGYKIAAEGQIDTPKSLTQARAAEKAAKLASKPAEPKTKKAKKKGSKG